jgi:hypothetical protein
MINRSRVIRVVVFIALVLAVSPPATAQVADNGASDYSSVRWDDSCQPGIANAARKNPAYAPLYLTLLNSQTSLRRLLEQVANPPTYQALLVRARQIASSLPTGRMVVTLPDGTVVVDTAGPDDAANTLPSGNSYQHFVNKTVNENHNSRVAIFSAQLYPCGVGIETKVSTSTGDDESYVALRLGAHLNSAGTARLSTTQ